MEIKEVQDQAKKATILVRAEENYKRLCEIKSQLCESFGSFPQGGETKDRPESPNVLDKIIERLADTDGELRGLSDYLIGEVINKIH